jgi:endonuclease/exonuclease/phosphatase family metal-dependent hydrolase
MRVATFNVLADTYVTDGDYGHASADLLHPGTRTDALTMLIGNLDAEVVGLQEVEPPLVDALAATDEWETFWSQKWDAPDGCLTLVKKGIEVDDDFEAHHYGDGSGHVMQMLTIGGAVVTNTHIKWELPSRIAQTGELLARISTARHAILMGDYNDRPGEPARGLVARAGFENAWGDEPTAYIANREGPAPLDLLAVRGLTAVRLAVDMGKGFTLNEIPSKRCPSDHIPVMAEVALPQ